MLLLPVFALAEDTATLVPVEFEDFTMYLSPDDGLQTAEKADLQVMAYVYPHYDENALVNQSISVIWTAQNATDLEGMDPTAFAQQMLDSIVNSMIVQNIAVPSSQLVDACQGDTSFILYYTMDVDYSALTIDLQATLHICSAALFLGERGSYIFTLTADSAESLEALTDYVANIEWKE